MKSMNIQVLVLSNIFMSIVLSQNAFGQNYYTTAATGNYTTPANWVGNIAPPIYIPNDVTINLLHEITNDDSISNNGLITTSNSSSFINNGKYYGLGILSANLINNGYISPGIKFFLANVMTTSFTDISCTSVTTGGNISFDGGSPVTNRGVCYSTQANPTIADLIVTSGSGTGLYTINISGLQADATYYIRAFASNGAGTVYGNELNFTTTNCSLPNAVSDCVSGQCIIQSCNIGYADCNNLASDGCETNVSTNENNCGVCGNVCSLPNAISICNNGICELLSCDAGFGDCNNDVSDGCETNLNSEIDCGFCGNACPPGFHCENGGCVIDACSQGFADCNGDPIDGCEIDIFFDPNNCGDCGIVCNFPNVELYNCFEGICFISNCVFGYDDCNGDPTDGCETFVNDDPNNCGSCGHVCGSIEHGTSGGCAFGSCFIEICDNGWADCDGIYENGCETEVFSNINNCGDCGIVCDLPNATATCVEGLCEILSCNPGWINEDGDPSNGCEFFE